MFKRIKLIYIVVALFAVISVLFFGACTQNGETAKPTPTPTPTEKPFVTQHWEPACFASAGATWDALNIACEYITDMSGGRIVAQASAAAMKASRVLSSSRG